MGKISKTSTLLLALIIVTLSLTTLTVPASAQSIPKPTVPEFTVNYIDTSYEVPATTTTSIDPYTGNKAIINQDGCRVNRQNITLIIKNQPFTAHVGSTTYHLCYDVITKGHFEEGNWQYLAEHRDFAIKLDLEQSTGQYTTISFQRSYPPNSKIDIRVMAMIFHEGQGIVFEHLGYVRETVNGFVYDITSDWSKIQTLNLTDGSVTASNQNPALSVSPPVPSLSTTPTSTAGISPYDPLSGNQQLANLAIIAVVAFASSAVSILVYRKYAGRTTHG